MGHILCEEGGDRRAPTTRIVTPAACSTARSADLPVRDRSVPRTVTSKQVVCGHGRGAGVNLAVDLLVLALGMSSGTGQPVAGSEVSANPRGRLSMVLLEQVGPGVGCSVEAADRFRGRDLTAPRRLPELRLEQGFRWWQSCPFGRLRSNFGPAVVLRKRKSRARHLNAGNGVLDITRGFSNHAVLVETTAIDTNQFMLCHGPGPGCNGRTWPRSAHHLNSAAELEIGWS